MSSRPQTPAEVKPGQVFHPYVTNIVRRPTNDEPITVGLIVTAEFWRTVISPLLAAGVDLDAVEIAAQDNEDVLGLLTSVDNALKKNAGDDE